MLSKDVSNTAVKPPFLKASRASGSVSGVSVSSG
jgi:hypothetical protein